MPKVTLSAATVVDGKKRNQGDVVDVDRATRNNLVFLGRARDHVADVSTAKPGPAPVKGEVK